MRSSPYNSLFDVAEYIDMSLGVTVVVMLCVEFLITSIMKYVMNESTNNSTTAISTKKIVFFFSRFFLFPSYGLLFYFTDALYFEGETPNFFLNT